MNEKSNTKTQLPNDLSFEEMNFYYNGCDFNSINNLLTPTMKCLF